ncbi:MAG: Hint domain-containing protein [Paracoccaceae bacterium]
MPTTYTDQFFILDPYNPPPPGTVLNFSTYDMIDQNDDGDIDRFNNDTVNGSDVTSSWPGDVVTVNVPGVGDITYTGTTFYLADGTQVFTPTDGQVLQNGTLVGASGVTTQGPLDTGTDLGPPCFTSGTLIETDSGERAIETLSVGDLVETLDNGLQPIRWIGSSVLEMPGRFAPILFRVGAIGNARELRVSPQHRMLIQGWQSELFFGCAQVLVPAKHLINGDTVVQERSAVVTYHHMLFDQHEIVVSDGVLSESFFPGDQALCQDDDVRRELLEIFPDMVKNPPTGWHRTARATVKRRDARVIRIAA